MQKLVLMVLVIAALGACKKDEKDPASPFTAIAGRWMPVSNTRPGGQPVAVTDPQAAPLIIRTDGIIVNEKGYKPCCSATSYTLNGVLMELKPQAPVQVDPSCVFVDCIACPNLQITSGPKDKLTTTYCGGYSTQYVRAK